MTDASLIDITFTLSKAEYVEAQRLYIKQRNPRVLLARRIVPGILFVVVASLAASSQYTVADAAMMVLGLTIVFACLTAVLLGLNHATKDLVLKYRYDIETKNTPASTNLHIDLYQPATSPSTQNWQIFTAWFEGPTVFTLISGSTLRPIPKRLLSATQQYDLRSLLQRSVAATA